MNNSIIKIFGKLKNYFLGNDNSVCIAVSGGADSTALLLLVNQFFLSNYNSNENITVLTVNHKLREEADSEAQMIQKWAEKLGIKCGVLTWEHGPLNSKIEELGRNARYELMTDYCLTNNIKTIMTAHHANDQIETFFMRLTRGSGLTGLCSMREVTNLKHINIFRPLLGVRAEELKNILKIFNHGFIDDPMNDLDKFERVRWRKFLGEMRNIIPSEINTNNTFEDNIIQSIKQLNEIRNDIDIIAGGFKENFVRVESDGFSIEFDEFSKQITTIKKTVINDVLRQCSADDGNYTPCSSKVIEGLLEKIIKPQFKTTTAHNCLISYRKNKILIKKENREINRYNKS